MFGRHFATFAQVWADMLADVSQIGPNFCQRSATGAIIRQLLHNFRTTSEHAGFAGVSFPGRVARTFSA